MDIRNAGQIKQKFKAVIAAFSLPYISTDYVGDLFRNLENLTTENALLYVSFMEGPRTRSGFEKTSFTGNDEIFINYYERSEIALRLREHHFNIETLFTKDYPETDGSITTDVIYVAKKHNTADTIA
jgi:hypothetical protein